MSKYEAELRRRLETSIDDKATARWFIECMIKSNVAWKDLTVFEVRFMKRIEKAFSRWMANRKLH